MGSQKVYRETVKQPGHFILKCGNFGVSSLIELKFFGEWSLQLFTMVFKVFAQVPMQGHTGPAWPGWLNL